MNVAAEQRSADAIVIGGGASAVAYLQAMLAHGWSQERQVVWMAPQGETGRGLAYATRDPLHRLNVRAGRMSVRADRSDDFVDYLGKHAESLGESLGDAFLPRMVYGDYLEHRAQAASEALGVSRWTARAVHVQRHGDHWWVRGDDGGHCQANILLLALGPVPDASPPLFAQVQSHPCYHANGFAWSNQVCAEATRAALNPLATSEAGYLELAHPKLWIVGSGLTAVDLALTAARHPCSEIHLLSRHGALPSVHAVPHGELPDPFAGAQHLPSVRQTLRTLRSAIHAANDWRDVIDGMRAYNADRWQRWPTPEKQRFLRHARWAWDISRHRMAPEVARDIEHLRDAGRLHVHAGAILDLAPSARGIRIRWQPRNGATRAAEANVLLRATGIRAHLNVSEIPLVRSLVDQGCAMIDPLQLGLRVDSDQRIVGNHGTSNAFVLGALAIGSRFECTAVPELRSMAAHQVRLIGA